MRLAIPTWELRVGQLLKQARLRAPFLHFATPRNFRAEVDRCTASFAAGLPRQPNFSYRRASASGLADELLRLADELDQVHEPTAAMYSEAAREIALERRLCEAAGEANFAKLAAERFAVRDDFDRAGRPLAMRWLHEHPSESPRSQEPRYRSDDSSKEASLIRQLQRRVGQLRLPFRVEVRDDLGALAATGNGILLVLAGQLLSESSAARLVVHEVDGHALPQAASVFEELGIFHFGTAHGFDDQEGRALWLEEQHGFFHAERKRALALRHLAADAVREGADFAQTVRKLESYATIAEAVAIAARCWRGGGLCREHVYLGAYLRFAEASDKQQQLLSRGAISIARADSLAPYVRSTDRSHGSVACGSASE